MKHLIIMAACCCSLFLFGCGPSDNKDVNENYHKDSADTPKNYIDSSDIKRGDDSVRNKRDSLSVK